MEETCNQRRTCVDVVYARVTHDLLKDSQWKRLVINEGQESPMISCISLITLLKICQRYGVHYRLLSTSVGPFACPGIDTQVEGTMVVSLIRQTLFVL
jgi:hypothetical protein